MTLRRELTLGALAACLFVCAGFVAAAAPRSSGEPPTAPSAAAVSTSSSQPGAPEGVDSGDRCAPRPLTDEDPRRIASYKLSVRLDPELHSIDGRGTIQFFNASATTLDHVFVHLYPNAFESDATVFGRQPASGFRGARGEARGSIQVTRFAWREQNVELWPSDPHTPDDPADRTDIRVPLPRPLAPGESMTVDLAWSTQLPSVVLRSGFAGSFHMAGQWFPKLAKLEPDGSFAHFPYERFSEFYADFGDYDVTIDAPSTFLVGATGSALETTAEDGRTRTRFTQRAVHDFAFVAWDGFASLEETHEGVALRVLYPRGGDELARRELDAAKEGLGFYGARFGGYPYASLTVVHPPDEAREAGGMEYPTLITTGDVGVPRWVPSRALEGLVLHELAHQWFYGLAATNENRWPFLDEGLTTWATGQALSALYGVGGVVPFAPFEVDLASIERAIQLGAHERGSVGGRASQFTTGADYGQLVYNRTSTLLRTIDGAWDGAASRAIRRWVCEGRFRHPRPESLENAIAAEGGPEAGAFFHLGAFEQGFLDFEPLSIENAAEDASSWETLVLVARRGSLRAPVVVELIDDQGARRRVRWDGVETSTLLRSVGPRPVVAVRVDPDGVILADENKVNDAYARRPHGFAPRTASVATLSFAAALGLLSL